MCKFTFKKNGYEKYSTHILKIYTSNGDMNEKVDNCLDWFEKFHKKYIILPSE